MPRRKVAETTCPATLLAVLMLRETGDVEAPLCKVGEQAALPKVVVVLW